MARVVSSIQASICPRKWFPCREGQPAQRHRSPCEHVLQRLSLPACLGAIRESVLRSEAPLESPDWLESHLPNRLALCHQTVEQQRGLGGVKKKRREGAFIWQRERQGTSVRGKERKCLCSCMSDDADYTVVILDWSLDLLGYTDCVGMSTQVKMKALQRERGEKYSIKLYLFPVDLRSLQNTNIQTKSRRSKYH